MALSQNKIEKIALQVIKVLHRRFADFPEDSSGIRNAPFHTAFLQAFREKLKEHVSDTSVFISLSSWFHGLNTTLGQSFFEKVSHILCDGEKKNFKETQSLWFSQKQQTAVSDIITALKNGQQRQDLQNENTLIFCNNIPQNKQVANFSADCYYEDTNSVVAIELKTVRPNSSVFKIEKDKILSAKAGLKNKYPNKVISYYLAFPFDPLSDTPTGSDKTRFMQHNIDATKFFADDEVLLAGELWDFLSGDTDTMQQILDIINVIASTDFQDKYCFLNNPQNRDKDWKKYSQQLEEWKLFSEIAWLDTVRQKQNKSKTLTHKLNQMLFDEHGKYTKDSRLDCFE
jgi:hypothetical protein